MEPERAPKLEDSPALDDILRDINDICTEEFKFESIHSDEVGPSDLSHLSLENDWSHVSAPNGFSSPAVPNMPYLTIIDQPIDRCRFRYRAEQGPHGSLRGMTNKKQKSSPKIRVENFSGSGYVVASLFTNEAQPRLHVNDLWGTSCEEGVCTVVLDHNQICSFPNLGIMRQKEKDVAEALYQKYLRESEQNGQLVTDELRESLRARANKEQVTMKDCLHSVKIGFQAVLTEAATGQKIVTPVVLSEPICNSQNPGYTELRIGEIDKSSGSVLGGDTIWMRCAAKVRKDQIKIKFFEPSSGWEAEGSFTQNEVYEQILIIFKTPAYHSREIQEPVHVSIYLHRTSDGERSPPIDFVYMPTDDAPPAKRPRLIPTYGPDTFGFSFDPNMGFFNNLPQPNQSSEIHAYMPAMEYGTNNAAAAVTAAQRKGIIRDPEEIMSLDELKVILNEKCTPEAGKKMQKIMSNLWFTHMEALWSFGQKADAKPFVTACKHLIGVQDQVDCTTVLHLAARNRDSNVTKTLLSALLDVPQKPTVVNARNIRGQTALHIAVRNGNSDSVGQLILAGAERTLLDREGNTVAHCLADTENRTIHREILSPPPDTVAAKQNLDLDVLNYNGCTALHLAVIKGNFHLFNALIAAGADLNQGQRNNGRTALHLAVQAGDGQMSRMLLENGAEVDVQALDGSTPLHSAVLNRHEPLVVLLIKHGADPDMQTAQWAQVFDSENDDEVVAGGGIELYSPREVADGNERLTRLLNGEALEPLLIPTNCPNRQHAVEVEEVPMQATSSSLPEFQEDLASLDFITRSRLSKLLNEDAKWEKLAVALDCQHMVEPIRVCSISDQSCSPTVLLLDQYEHMANATVGRLLQALGQIDEKQAKLLIEQAVIKQ